MSQPAAELVEQVYQELRRLADGYVRHERAKSVQATELVHEVYLRLQKDASPQWRERGHFLAIAAISMRRLLVERARARGASKRGGDQIAVTIQSI
jgi:RNA polymerase sigma factor (TIGR02999 family)